ncbi:MAG: DUF86 domain-containing protein [Chitinispirillales bacterium]|jgi:uncharacterized protein with HEPN domain|nr:DUF86 domain-containing protein [Chitinispirillales bacterium]
MDKTKRNLSALEHIVKYCEEIEETHKKFGDKLETLKEDKDYFKSVTMSLFQIGELANHLSESFMNKYSDVPWKVIIGLRNIIAHGYGSLVYERVWDTSHEDAPILQKRCLEIIRLEKES